MITQTDKWEIPKIPCSMCSTPTAMIATKLCDGCWELKRRIEMDPELAQKIPDTLL